MLLLLDFRNDKYRVAALDGKKKAVWFAGPPAKGGFPLLDKAMKKHGLGRRAPTHVGVTVFGKAPKEALRPSWSTMRAAVATANALALAWDATAFGVPVAGDEDNETLAAVAVLAKATAEKGVWVRPDYGGEPTITTPKSAAR